MAVGARREAAFGGMRADEQDYECTVCGQRWMHETGNSGCGWMLDSD
jgi:transposase-like protein